MYLIHRHLNSSIVYFDDNYNPKITDFSDSKISFHEDYYYGGIKTPYYDSPELKSGETISNKTDVYSFGVILLSIVQGNEKFKFKKWTRKSIYSRRCTFSYLCHN